MDVYAFKKLPWSQPERQTHYTGKGPSRWKKSLAYCDECGKNTIVRLVSILHQTQCLYLSSDKWRRGWDREEETETVDAAGSQSPTGDHAIFPLQVCGFDMCLDTKVPSCLFASHS